MNRIKSAVLILICTGVGYCIACKKYEDPKPPPINLTNRYCNDPIAVNYNHGFPGIADNGVCVYATDLLSGNWLFVDSIFRSDSTFYQARQYNLLFSATPSDSLRRKLTVSGFCSNNNTLKITANKYGNAVTDTMLPLLPGGQFFCGNNDTVSGSFLKVNDTINKSMRINLMQKNANGQFYHRGIAIKQ